MASDRAKSSPSGVHRHTSRPQESSGLRYTAWSRGRLKSTSNRDRWLTIRVGATSVSRSVPGSSSRRRVASSSAMTSATSARRWWPACSAAATNRPLPSSIVNAGPTDTSYPHAPVALHAQSLGPTRHVLSRLSPLDVHQPACFEQLAVLDIASRQRSHDDRRTAGPPVATARANPSATGLHRENQSDGGTPRERGQHGDHHSRSAGYVRATRP